MDFCNPDSQYYWGQAGTPAIKTANTRWSSAIGDKATPLVSTFHSKIREEWWAELHTLKIPCPVSIPGAAQNIHHLNGTPAYTSRPHSQNKIWTQFNIHQVNHIDHQKENPQSRQNKSSIAMGSSRRPETIRLWKQKGCIFQMFPTTYKNKCGMWCLLSFINLFLQESAIRSKHFLEVPCMHSLWMLLYNFIS